MNSWVSLVESLDTRNDIDSVSLWCHSSLVASLCRMYLAQRDVMFLS